MRLQTEQQPSCTHGRACRTPRLHTPLHPAPPPSPPTPRPSHRPPLTCCPGLPTVQVRHPHRPDLLDQPSHDRAAGARCGGHDHGCGASVTKRAGGLTAARFVCLDGEACERQRPRMERQPAPLHPARVPVSSMHATKRSRRHALPACPPLARPELANALPPTVCLPLQSSPTSTSFIGVATSAHCRPSGWWPLTRVRRRGGAGVGRMWGMARQGRAEHSRAPCQYMHIWLRPVSQLQRLLPAARGTALP